MMIDDGNYTIHPDYIARVKEIVDWTLDTGMYAIINIHWDNGPVVGETLLEHLYVTVQLGVVLLTAPRGLCLAPLRVLLEETQGRWRVVVHGESEAA